MKVYEIEKVLYVGKSEELYIKFVAPVVLSYDTVCFVNVPLGTAQRFKNAESREEFFAKEIKTKYKYYATHIAFAEVQIPHIYKTATANELPTYNEYKEREKQWREQFSMDAEKAL